MAYHGKLYGKLWDKYFETSHTTDNFDLMKKQVAELKAEIEELNQANRFPPVNYTEMLAYFQNDKYLKLLYKDLNDLHLKAIPIIIKVSPTEMKAIYDDKTNEAISRYHKVINFRQEQILSFVKKEIAKFK